MTKGIASGGVDFDALFDPDVQGDGPTAAGWSSNGVLLKYAALKYGTKRANVGYAVNGSDVSNLWAAKGTAVYALPIDGNTYHGDSSGAVSANTGASVTVHVNADGTYSVNCLGNQLATVAASGNWLPAGQSASDYQVQFAVTTLETYSSGGATITNSAAAYAACTADQSVQFTAQVGQLTAQDKGGNYQVVINLKRISTGVVSPTTITCEVESVGSG